MSRLPLIAICLLLSASALAQQHKISVQKFEPPWYPPIARQARIEGIVKLALDLDAEGNVVSLKVIQGHPMLTTSSTDTIKKWRFHCDDCSYGESFHHNISIDFRIGNWDEHKSVSYRFPDSVTAYSQAAVVMGIFGISRPRHVWLWKLFHPKSWHFHDYDHDL